MKIISLFLTTLLMINLGWAVDIQGPTAFATDFCTNYPEGTKQDPSQWKHCCLMHDMYFWAGGTKEDRKSSDSELKACIEETGAKNEAILMYWAVKTGSLSPIKYADKKWNNGWRERPDHQALTVEDIDLIEEKMDHSSVYISSEQRAHFINTLRAR